MKTFTSIINKLSFSFFLPHLTSQYNKMNVIKTQLNTKQQKQKSIRHIYALVTIKHATTPTQLSYTANTCPNEGE